MIQLVHYQQTDPGGKSSCVPACVKMILDSYGRPETEEKLCEVLQTELEGTELANLLNLPSQLGLEDDFFVEWKRGASEDLIEIVHEGLCVIIVLAPAGESHSIWKHSGIHTIVVTDYHDDHFLIHDPKLSKGPISIGTDTLIELWAEADSVMFVFKKH